MFQSAGVIIVSLYLFALEYCIIISGSGPAVGSPQAAMSCDTIPCEIGFVIFSPRNNSCPELTPISTCTTREVQRFWLAFSETSSFKALFLECSEAGG
jgi:hypothetical protein